MTLRDFDSIVVLCYADRYPRLWERVRDQVRAHGAECSLFLNGPPDSQAAHLFDQINDVLPPAGWPTTQALWNHTRAIHTIVENAALEHRQSVLLLEDDCMFALDIDATLAAITLPDDWELFYLGALHEWSNTYEAGRNLLRLESSVCSHAVAFHSRAYEAVLRRKFDRNIDNFMADHFHPRGHSYAAWPQAAVQAPGLSTITGSLTGGAGMFASKGKNWPQP